MVRFPYLGQNQSTLSFIFNEKLKTNWSNYFFHLTLTA